jgi:hypothetical protein
MKGLMGRDRRATTATTSCGARLAATTMTLIAALALVKECE